MNVTRRCRMKPLVFSFLVASAALGAAAAPQDETIAVLELRSRANPISAAEASDRLREALRRAAPEARIVDRTGDADYVLSGKLSRGGIGYRVWLELRDRTGELVQRASATAGSRRELLEAVEAATSDLLAARPEALAAGPLTIAPIQLPEVPAPVESSQDDSVLNLEADANVLVAWDRARRVEARGKDMPEDAAYAWRRLASMPGLNPFREIALTRAQQWDAFASAKRAAETQQARDVQRLRKVLPLRSLGDEAKIDLLVRFATAYGFDKMSPLVALLPAAEARARAELSLDCEVKDAAACVRLARVHEEGEGVPASPKLAADAREKACNAGDGKSCRRLAGMSDEAGRIADLLRKGCDGGDSVSCALAAREPALVQRELQEASAAAKKAKKSAVTPAAAQVPPATQPPASPPRTEETSSGSGNGKVAAGMILFGALAGAGALMLALDDSESSGSYRRGPGRNLVYQAPQPNTGRTVLTVLMGSAAVITTGAGLAVLFSKPKEPEKPSVGVGVSTTGVVVSGSFH